MNNMHAINILTNLKCSGKFDVDTDDNRIIFDDENGKRHMIYWTTGTVIIDEN